MKDRIKKALTPKNTEEVKPDLFIQAVPKRNGEIKYRQIYPACWNGKINKKNLFTGGPNFWKNTLLFLIIIFLTFSYIHDTSQLVEFNQKVNKYKAEWCAGVPYEELGGVNGDSITIQNNLGKDFSGITATTNQG